MNRAVATGLAVAVLAGCGGEPLDVQAIEQNLDAQDDDLGMFITGIEASGNRIVVSTQLGADGGDAEAEAICGNVVSASYVAGDKGVTTDVTGVDVRDATGSTVATCEPRV